MPEMKPSKRKTGKKVNGWIVRDRQGKMMRFAYRTKAQAIVRCAIYQEVVEGFFGYYLDK